MRKLNLLFFAVVGMLMSAMTVFAQARRGARAVDNNAGLESNRCRHWFCDRGVWRRAWSVANRRGGLRRRGA